VITYDQRGNGRTVARGKRYTNATMAGDLVALLDHLGVERAYIVGHSMGGRTAMKFAALYPERTRALAVEDMHIRGATVDYKLSDRIVAKMRAMPSSFATFAAGLAAIRGAYFGAQDEWATGLADGHLVRGADGRFRFDLRLDVGELWESYALYEDLAPTLGEVTAPTLFLRGDERMGGVILTPELAAAVARAKPDARIVRVDGADHSIHHMQPRAFLDLLQAFFGAP
jgi:esterase